MGEQVFHDPAPATQPVYAAGDAVIDQLGLIRLADGREVMGVLLTFPAGPPPLPASMAWDGTAFELKPKSK